MLLPKSSVHIAKRSGNPVDVPMEGGTPVDVPKEGGNPVDGPKEGGNPVDVPKEGRNPVGVTYRAQETIKKKVYSRFEMANQGKKPFIDPLTWNETLWENL